VPPMARLLTVGAVLVGLAFMHGVGTAAGTGCPGGTSATATGMPPAMAGGHEAGHAEAAPVTPFPALVASAPRSAHSSVCDSTPPRGNVTGRAAQAVVELVQPCALGHVVPGAPRGSDAVPRAGPALLTGLCVSRT
jgi:hypothetical protein